MIGRFALIASVVSLTMAVAPVVHAQDTTMDYDATIEDIETTFGSVPSFIRQIPRAALPGAWAELKALQFSESVLDAKTKALIGVAVSAQIPCNYCVWADTNTAKQAGATDEEIAEAVGVAAVTRQWSTYLNGLQVDFETFKSELGGEGTAMQ
jgi:AhpD family alkylhydroperoxidase